MKKSILLLFLFSVISCTGESSGGGFRSSDKEYTKYLIQELDKQKIKYSINKEGFITYTAEFEESFHKAEKKVHHILYEGTSIKPKNIEEQQFLLNLLKSENLEYYVINKEDGNWVKWYPKNENHRLTIIQKLADYVFEKQSSCNDPCN